MVNPRRLEDKSIFLKSPLCSALGNTGEEQRWELGAHQLACSSLAAAAGLSLGAVLQEGEG